MFQVQKVVQKYSKFFLQSILVSVSFIDPGNFSSNTTSGSKYEYKLLFVILFSNIFAIVFQCLCIKLGSITGLSLAENCRRHLPKWLNIFLYVCAEVAIVATDLAEVVGTAIALQVLFKIPLNVGVILTICDVIAVLFFYDPQGSLKSIKLFEAMVSVLVLLTMACFVMELFSVDIKSKSDVLKGFLPSKALIEGEAVYLGCAIVGATIMPHSLYLGSALVQPRLKEYDAKHGLLSETEETEESHYKPSLQSIQYSLTYSYWELIISLLLVATFVNSAILIVAGAALFGTPEAADADLVTIYELLVTYVSRGAGLVFTLAMLFSGQASGLVVTIAGQVVSEGFIKWTFQPWVRRLITRMMAIAPCLFVTYTMGRKGINDVLNGSQVVLSLVLPIISAPLIYFTSCTKFMTVQSKRSVAREREADEETVLLQKNERVDFSNSTPVTVLTVFAWVLISGLNLLNIVFAFTENE